MDMFFLDMCFVVILLMVLLVGVIVLLAACVHNVRYFFDRAYRARVDADLLVRWGGKSNGDEVRIPFLGPHWSALANNPIDGLAKGCRLF
jgi:hypothetical protein